MANSWWPQVDEKFFPAPKILYITLSLAFYSFYLFRGPFSLRYLGLNKAEYGELSAMMAIVGFLSMTPWGKIADATGRHRLVLALGSFGTAASFVLFVFKPASHNATFWLSGVILVLYSLFSSSMQPLTDYHALKLLDDRPGASKELYGRQRVWGTIAYGVISWCQGPIIDLLGLKSLFYIVPTTATLFIITVYTLTSPDHPIPIKSLFKKNQLSNASQENLIDGNGSKMSLEKGAEAIVTEGEEKEAKKESVLIYEASEKIDLKVVAAQAQEPEQEVETKHPLIRLMTNPDYVFLLLFVFLSGAARGVMTAFLTVFLTEDMNLTKTQAANASIFGLLLEIPLFFAAPFMLNFFGIYWLLILAQMAMVARCWLYVIMPISPKFFWLVYTTELLKGVAFGLNQTAGVKICVDVAPIGLEATAQAIFTSFYSQLPVVLSAFFGGRLYEHFGSKALFLSTSIISTIAMSLFLIKYTLDGRLCGDKRHIRKTFSVLQSQEQQPPTPKTPIKETLQKDTHETEEQNLCN